MLSANMSQSTAPYTAQSTEMTTASGRGNTNPASSSVGFTLDAFINNMRLSDYPTLDPQEKQDRLDRVDALELFTAVQEVSRELAVVKLENHFLIDFLEKNDPKLLIGLRQRRVTASLQRRPTLTSNISQRYSSYERRSLLSRRSVLTTTQSLYTSNSAKRGYDYRLNYRAKVNMAEKTAADVEKRVRDIETKAMHDIKLLNAHIEELRLRCQETQETAKNFQLHFLRDERDILFLESATEKQLDRKLRKFINNWNKNARSLLGTMRLRVTALQESCQQHRSDLLTKADLSGILGAVDFEQLMIKRTELLNSLDDKNAHMAGLKGVTGKASMAMSEEKQVMMAIEDEGRRITNRTVDVIKHIAKLEKEAKLVEDSNNKDLRTLQHLKEQLERYEAPSVNEYIERKDEMLGLEKEEKMLQRKISILTMKFNNILKKCKKKEQDN